MGAWGFLLYQAWQMQHLPMSAMWMAPAEWGGWKMADFAWVFAMWAVMMAAMMLPTALPMLGAFARTCRHDPGGPTPRTLAFVGGYLAAWCLFSLGATLLQWLFHGWAWLSPMMETHHAGLSAALFMLAGGYQFTAYKQACLRHCRTPIGFLLTHWRPGLRGATRVGFRHGATCVGCCWAEMLIMFAVGVMNIGGMLLLTLLAIVEKWAPFDSANVSRGVGLLLIVVAGLYL